MLAAAGLGSRFFTTSRCNLTVSEVATSGFAVVPLAIGVTIKTGVILTGLSHRTLVDDSGFGHAGTVTTLCLADETAVLSKGGGLPFTVWIETTGGLIVEWARWLVSSVGPVPETLAVQGTSVAVSGVALWALVVLSVGHLATCRGSRPASGG